MGKGRVKRAPEPGTVFRHTYKGTPYEMIVVMTDDGIRYKVGERVFKSPTAAAKSIVGDQFINGRSFWHMDD